MTNLDSILKSRHITLSTMVRLIKAMVFPVVMYGCESWTIKKAEHRRIDAFELWCWRRLLRVCKEIQPVHPKGDQSWVFIGRTDVEAETPILWPPDKNWLTKNSVTPLNCPALNCMSYRLQDNFLASLTVISCPVFGTQPTWILWTKWGYTVHLWGWQGVWCFLCYS